MGVLHIGYGERRLLSLANKNDIAGGRLQDSRGRLQVVSPRLVVAPRAGFLHRRVITYIVLPRSDTKYPRISVGDEGLIGVHVFADVNFGGSVCHNNPVEASAFLCILSFCFATV